MARTRMLARHVTTAGLVAWTVLLLPAVARAQKIVFIVRHAERADGGASAGMTAEADPLLSSAGQARAAKLAAMLAEAGIRAVYVTEFRRSRDTGRPLAETLGLTAQSVSSTDTTGLVARLRQEHRDDIVLIVGHTNTIPAIIKALGGPIVTIGDNEYDNLFILVPGTGTMTRIRF